MGNTLGAIVFLAAGTFLGWLIVKGRAQSFLAALAGGDQQQQQPPPASNAPQPLYPVSVPNAVTNAVFGPQAPLNGSDNIDPNAPYDPGGFWNVLR